MALEQDSVSSSSAASSPAASPSSSPRSSASAQPSALSLVPVQSTTTSSASNQRNENIIVAVRVRPFDKRELGRDESLAWEIDTEENEMRQTMTNTKYKHQRINNSHSKVDQPPQLLSFKCGNLFDQDTSTIGMYNGIVRDIVDSAMKGINGTVFAYGQTSSGKTFTMKGNSDSHGVIRLAMQQVFETILANPDHEWLLRVSYLEIYNENVRDLLNPSAEDLPVHESKERGVYVQQKEVIVNSVDNVLALMDQGEGQRHYGKTLMNDLSSRSHTIFRLVIESKKKKTEEELAAQAAAAAASKKGGKQFNRATALKKEKVKCSVLNFVDLAGSERLSQTQAQGQQQKEGMCINKSLLFLGLVISRLAAGDKINHIPFRDSKLTRILQSSLGGNSRTAIICNVSPALSNCEHTINTLRFGANAIKIRNHAKVNEITGDKALIHKHEIQIAELQSRLSTFPEQEDAEAAEQQIEEEEKFDHEAERKMLEEEREKAREQKAKLEEKVEELRRMILNSEGPSLGGGLPLVSRRRATFGGTQEFNSTLSSAHLESDNESSMYYRVEQQKSKISKLEGLLSELSIENTQLMSQVTELTNEQESMANQLEELAAEHEKTAKDAKAREDKLTLIEQGAGIEERSTDELKELQNLLEQAQKRILKHLHWREFAESTQIQAAWMDNTVASPKSSDPLAVADASVPKSSAAASTIHKTINFIEKTQRLEHKIAELQKNLHSEQEKQMAKDDLLMKNMEKFETFQSNALAIQANLQSQLEETRKTLAGIKVENQRLIAENQEMSGLVRGQEKENSELKAQNVEYSIQLLKYLESTGQPVPASFMTSASTSSSVSQSKKRFEPKVEEIRVEEVDLQPVQVVAESPDADMADENSMPIGIESAPASRRSSIGGPSQFGSQELSMDDLLAHHSSGSGETSLPPHLQWAAGLATHNSGAQQMKNPVLSLLQPNQSILRELPRGATLNVAQQSTPASKIPATPLKTAPTPLNTPLKASSAAKTGIPMRGQAAKAVAAGTGTATKRK